MPKRGNSVERQNIATLQQAAVSPTSPAPSFPSPPHFNVERTAARGNTAFFFRRDPPSCPTLNEGETGKERRRMADLFTWKPFWVFSGLLQYFVGLQYPVSVHFCTHRAKTRSNFSRSTIHNDVWMYCCGAVSPHDSAHLVHA